MAAILFYLGVTQMFVGVINPSIEAAKESQGIQDKINQINNETKDIQDRFDAINNEVAKIDQSLRTDVQDKINNISKMHAQIYEAKNQINSSEKKIQMFGIIFICFIFFALLVREFDLLSDIKIF